MLESRGKPTPLEVVMPSPFPGAEGLLADQARLVAHHLAQTDNPVHPELAAIAA